MITIKNHVFNMVENFKKSHFFLSVAQNQHYDEDTVFNENNVVLYLAELEEYISLFITYLAYKQENPDAAISSLSLDQMDVKEFDRNRNQLNIQALNSQDMMQMNDDMETQDDDITTDPTLLFKKFEDMWNKDNAGKQ